MALIRLDCPLIDYFTLTSYSKVWFDSLVHCFVDNVDKYVDIKRGGYVGRMIELVSGTISLMVGKSMGKPHYMISVSGGLSHHAVASALELSRPFQVRCTRLDVQVTRIMRKNFSMKALRNRLEKSGRKVGYPTPSKVKGVELETVYINTRTKSDRFYRVYMKPVEDGMMAIRFEAELKKRRSRAIFDSWMKDGYTVQDLVYELEAMSGLDRIMAKEMRLPNDWSSRVIRVRTDSSNTEAWLLKTVMPSLRRFINSHDSNPVTVLGQLSQILEDFYNEK